MANMPRDIWNPPCPAIPEKWITGVIVAGTDGTAAVQDDQGTVHPLIWGSQNKAAVEWGRRYKLGGTMFEAAGGRWWVQCENEVVPL